VLFSNTNIYFQEWRCVNERLGYLVANLLGLLSVLVKSFENKSIVVEVTNRVILPMCWTEVIQRAPDKNDRYSKLSDGLPVLAPSSHPGCSDNERRVYTLTLPLSNGTCHRRSTAAVDSLPICSVIQSSPWNGSATVDAMSLPSSKRVHFARPFC